MITYIFSAIITMVICLILHLAWVSAVKVPVFESAIRKLFYHAKVLGGILFLMLPVFFIIRWSAAKSGMDIFIEESGYLNAVYGAHAILLFWCLFFFYLTIYYGFDRSVSSRIMIEIEKPPEKELSFEDILKVYDTEDKYRNIIEGMIQGGFVKEESGRYICTSKGAIVAGIARLFKKLMKLGPGG